MRKRLHLRVIVVIVAGATAALLTVEKAPSARRASKLSHSVPRTPWGDPDLQGAFTNNDERGAPMERPDGFSGWRAEWVPRAELARLNKERTRAMRGGGTELESFYEHPEINNSRPWLVSDPPDGRIPPWTPEARRRAAERGAGTLRQLRDTGPWVSSGLFGRCITRGLPAAMTPFAYGNTYLIAQSPGFVVITYEMVHEARVIPLDGRPHVGEGIRTYLGDARGRFEGDMLVVETRNFNDRTPFHGSSEHLTLVERFTPIDADRLEWSVTLDDPATWIGSWTFALNLTRATEGPLEFACHEGNYSMRYSLGAGPDGVADSRQTLSVQRQANSP